MQVWNNSVWNLECFAKQMACVYSQGQPWCLQLCPCCCGSLGAVCLTAGCLCNGGASHKAQLLARWDAIALPSHSWFGFAVPVERLFATQAQSVAQGKFLCLRSWAFILCESLNVCHTVIAFSHCWCGWISLGCQLFQPTVVIFPTFVLQNCLNGKWQTFRAYANLCKMFLCAYNSVSFYLAF